MVKSGRTIKNIVNGEVPIYRKTNRLPLDKLSVSQKFRVLNDVKAKIATSLESVHKMLNNYGYTFGEISILKLDENEENNNCANNLKFEPKLKVLSKTPSQIDIEKKEILQTMCNLKDELLISDKNYDKLQKRTGMELPTLYHVRKARLTLNQTLFKVYRNEFGNYVNCETKIRYMITKFISLLNVKNGTIRVKLCGDGTNCGQIKLFNFCFTLPDQGKAAKTAFGNFTLGVFKISKENYSTLKLCLAECARNLNQFSTNNQIEIDGVKYKIKFLLTGDMKFLHAVMGLNACNSKHSCVWCKHETSEFHKFDSISENPLLRSTKEAIEVSKNLNIDETIHGQQNVPIFEFIELEDVIFDTLHLLLRITEKLIRLKYKELIELDGGNSKELDELPHQKRFFEYLNEIGVKDPYSYVRCDTESGICMKLKVRTLNGDDCLKILQHMNFNDIFPAIHFPKYQSRATSSEIFNSFYDIFMKLKKKFYDDNIDSLKTDTSEWLTTFINEYHKNHVTPYMHLFSSHLCFFVELHGDVDLFNISGLEKLNDLTTSQTFKQSNRSSQFCYQILCSRNRLENFRPLKDTTKKAVKRSKMKQLRKEIHEHESKMSWCQYKLSEYVISSDEIQNFASGQYSINLIEASMSLLKTAKTLILGSSMIKKIYDGEFINASNDLALGDYDFLAGLLEIHTQIYLIFMSNETKTFYFIDLFKENTQYGTLFLENWLSFLRENNLDVNTQWNYEMFNHSKLENTKKLDVAILMIFQSLIKKKVKLTKFTEKNLITFRDNILYLCKERADLVSFCSRCSHELAQQAECYECQCTRRFHKSCLDTRYLRMYKYESFLCFFCRDKKKKHKKFFKNSE